MTNELKEAYKNNLQAKYEQGKAQLDLLKAKAKEAVSSGQIKAEEDLQQTQSSLDAVKAKIGAIEQLTEDGLDELKAGAEKAWTDFENSLTAAKNKISG